MYPPAYFLPDDGDFFDIFCREGPEDDEADEVDQGCGHDGGDGGHGVAEEDEQGVVDEPGHAGHGGAGQKEFPDVAPLDAVGNVFTGKVKIERRSDGQIGIGRQAAPTSPSQGMAVKCQLRIILTTAAAAMLYSGTAVWPMPCKRPLVICWRPTRKTEMDRTQMAGPAAGVA
jgi:hypothetical protein